MSRYRNDRDEDYSSGFSRERRAGNSGNYYDEDRYEQGRDDYGRASSGRDYPGGYDVSNTRERSRFGGGRDYDDYGRDRADERTGSYRDDYYDRGRRRSAEHDDGRSLYEEGRDYLRRRLQRRGATRSHVRCRDIMTRDVTVATRDTPLQEVAAMMRDEDTGVIPVVDRGDAAPAAADASSEARKVQSNPVGNGKLVGLITDRDVVIRAVAEGKDTRAVRAEEIMTEDIHTAQPNDRVIDAIRKMGDKQVRRIPVVDRDGNLRGIISMADVALETEEDRELADALEEISSGSSFWSKVFG